MTAAEIVERMAALGDTAEDVADSLDAAGVKGPTGDGGACPLAVWAQRQHGDVTGPCVVAPHKLILWPDDPSSSEAALPPALRDFVRLFDAGEFPDLECSS